MDKYVINANTNGRINYVGVNTENGFEIIEIKDNENAVNYVKELQEINKRFGGDFLTAINNPNVKVVSKKVLDELFIQASIPGTEIIKQKAIEAEQPVQETKPATENIKKKLLNKKVAAIAAAVLIAVGATKAYANTNNIKFKDAMKNIKSKALAASIFNAKDTKTSDASTDSENLEGKSVEELIGMLKTDEQKQAFTKIVNTQDYFNEQAAPTVKQGDKQLFFTFDETSSAYLYANAKALSSKKLASIFGQSKIMLFNEETGEYETMDKDTVAAKYLSFNLNLSYYYQLGATEKSGVDQIFENEKEAEFFRNFEALILEYNKTKSPEVAAQIRAELENIFMSGEVDSLMSKYQGACSIIGTSMVPYLYLNDVIDEDMYNSLVEINESITCDEIYNQIGKITESLKANGQEDIIEQIAKLQNLKTAKLDRNVDMTNSLEGYGLDDLDNVVLGSTPGFTKKKTVTKHYRKVTKDRKEAVRLAGEKAVRDAEKKADEELNKKNKEENKKADELKEGYNDTYNDAFNGNGDHRKEDGSDSYNEGADKGVEAGKEDRKQADEDQKNYDNTHPEKREEVIEETFVPEVSTSSAKETQKVVSVESHEPVETKSISVTTSDGTEYESEAKVLVRE